MIDIEKIPQVCIGLYYRDCKNMLNRYIEVNYDEISHINKNYPHVIRIDGNEIYFMTREAYKQWCKGRIYRFYGDDRVYHSGYPLQLSDDIWI